MIKVNLNKAVEIAHRIRQNKRQEEFSPLDAQMNIPSLAEQAEQQRQVIRDKYDAIQTEIDQAEDVETLENIVQELL